MPHTATTPESRLHAALHQRDLADVLEAADWPELAARARLQDVAAAETLYREGEDIGSLPFLLSGEVKLIKDLDRKIEGRDVIIVEDIIDSGYTLSYLKRMLYSRKPSSVKICALLDKYSRRVVPIEADYKGFDCADEFVVGFGLDYAERYRNLPYIGILKRSVYEK